MRLCRCKKWKPIPFKEFKDKILLVVFRMGKLEKDNIKLKGFKYETIGVLHCAIKRSKVVWHSVIEDR
jgi:hypothetical protein